MKSKLLWMAGVLIVLGGICVSCASHKLSWVSPYREISSLKEGDILHIPTGVVVTEKQLINILSGARVVYVGEAHDNVNSHKVQLDILKALAEQHPGKIAVGMEMLKRTSQDVADKWTSGELDEKELVRTWVKDWSNDFQYYRPILHYVQEHKIPLLALRAPDDWVETIRGDADPTAQPERNEEPLPNMDVKDAYHRAHIKAVFGKHPKHMQSFESFYKVQVLWDESMAASVSEYLLSEGGQDKQVLIFAGQQHVEYGFGIPRRVFRRVPFPYAIILTTVVGFPPEKQHKLMNVTLPDIPLLPGDFAWMVSYKDLEDERVYLGVMVQDAQGGVKILGVSKDSSAEKGGLEKDDIITAFDGEPIKTTFDLTYSIGQKKPGETGLIEILRDEKPLRFEVTFQAGGPHK